MYGGKVGILPIMVSIIILSISGPDYSQNHLCTKSASSYITQGYSHTNREHKVKIKRFVYGWSQSLV